MIGNTDDLPGVPVDISDYYDFFTSPAGGHWYDDEIDVLLNPTQHKLLETIADIEEADYDYLITVFSGHGEETSDGTVLAINGERETILLHNLTELAERQLLIIDCCLSHHRIPAAINIDSATLSLSRDSVRQVYEELIQRSAPQEVILFACNRNSLSLHRCRHQYIRKTHDQTGRYVPPKDNLLCGIEQQFLPLRNKPLLKGKMS